MLLGGAIALAVLIIGGLIFMSWSSPRGELKDYLKTVEKHKAAAAESYLQGEDDTDQAHQLTEKWTGSEEVKYKIIKDESWKEKEGAFKPTAKYLASNYKARVRMTVDGESKTYEITMKRKGAKSEWSVISYMLKGWEITAIQKYKKED